MKSDPSNYRGIRLTPQLSEMLKEFWEVFSYRIWNLLKHVAQTSLRVTVQVKLYRKHPKRLNNINRHVGVSGT